MSKAKPKTKVSALRVKQEMRSEVASVAAVPSPRSKMETLALEYDLMCAVEEELRNRDGKPGRHFINTIDRRLPAIEGLLSTSEPKNLNDLFIFAIMLRSKLVDLRAYVGPIIDPEKERGFTLKDHQAIVPDLRAGIADLQAMITVMLDGFELVSGTTAKKLGIARIASGPDGSE